MVLGGGYGQQARHVQYRSIRRVIGQYGLTEVAKPVSRAVTSEEHLNLR
jgi:hypothetical protein